MNDYPLAGRWQRLGGYLLDILILAVTVLPLIWLTGDFEQESLSFTRQIVWVAAGFALYLALNGYPLAKYGQSIGKQLVGTQIVDLDGAILPFGRLITLRYLVFAIIFQIPVLGLILGLADAVWIFGRQKRCLHDILAGTKVVAVESGLTPVPRRTLQAAGLVVVLLLGLLFYRLSLFATGNHVGPGNYQLAFYQWKPSTGNDIYVLDVEQETVTQITMNHKVSGMMWLPDGQAMLLRRSGRDATFDLLDVKTGKAKQIDEDQFVSPGLNGWSLNGQHRAVAEQQDGDADQEIYIVEADGARQRLVQNPGVDGGPAWSPDNRQLAFWTRHEKGWILSTINADGTNLTPIYQTPAPSPPIDLVWSPDGSRLAFTGPLYDQWGGITQAHVFIIDTDGQNLIELGEINWRNGPAQWSPDGQTVAFDTYGAMCLYSLADDLPDDRRLFCNSSAQMPAWSPDGRYLAYVQSFQQSQPGYLCVKSIDHLEEHCFKDETAGASYPKWRPTNQN